MSKYLLGYDIGSSSIKAALIEISTGKNIASVMSPDNEMRINAPKAGWAEQDPESWWKEVINATAKISKIIQFSPDEIAGIGISYQMHGLVCVDEHQQPLRPSIIWCDSRAVEMGKKAFAQLGQQFCLEHYLNSPGNFTASKLRWVQENEPAVYKKIHRIMLPGDYIAMRLTGDIRTTVSGLSEGIFWDMKEQRLAEQLMEFYNIDPVLLAEQTPTFGIQGELTKAAAELLKIAEGTPVTYRAGDQPNNAFSLNVLQPGEVAATAGTSGVIYGITDKPVYDLQSRVNTFIHVNNKADQPRYGVLLCVNGTGILNSWLRRNIGDYSYDDMNRMAATVNPGSEGLLFYPFGNGAERILGNANPGAQLSKLDFNRHSKEHVLRAAQEGIVFALRYGFDIMGDMGVHTKLVKAGFANMFFSQVFQQIFANTIGAGIELYETDGAQGAARAAGVGAGVYASSVEAYKGMEAIAEIEPQQALQQQYESYYQEWKKKLEY